jgi:hypothetical protein
MGQLKSSLLQPLVKWMSRWLTPKICHLVNGGNSPEIREWSRESSASRGFSPVVNWTFFFGFPSRPTQFFLSMRNEQFCYDDDKVFLSFRGWVGIEKIENICFEILQGGSFSSFQVFHLLLEVRKRWKTQWEGRLFIEFEKLAELNVIELKRFVVEVVGSEVEWDGGLNWLGWVTWRQFVLEICLRGDCFWPGKKMVRVDEQRISEGGERWRFDWTHWSIFFLFNLNSVSDLQGVESLPASETSATVATSGSRECL